MNMKKLNSRGISHLLVPLVAVVVIAVAGTFAVVASHANAGDATAAAAKKSTGSLTVMVKYQTKKCLTSQTRAIGASFTGSCPVLTDYDATVKVTSTSGKGSCKKLNDRHFKCTAGTYTVTATRARDFFHTPKGHSPTHYYGQQTITVHAGKTTTIRLGSTEPAAGQTVIAAPLG